MIHRSALFPWHPRKAAAAATTSRKAATWAEFKSADSDGDGIIKDEWRRWNMEKQKLMRDANADGSAL